VQGEDIPYVALSKNTLNSKIDFGIPRKKRGKFMTFQIGHVVTVSRKVYSKAYKTIRYKVKCSAKKGSFMVWAAIKEALQF
jgi:hypothetical protein